MQVVIISGLSGSGKSVALKVLEDAGYYCVDNLPVGFMPQVVAFLTEHGHTRVSLAIDARGGSELENLPTVMQDLRASNIDVRVLFLEAKTESLVKRFSETRRPHPLANEQRTLNECIDLERQMLEAIGELGHRLDTSDLRPNTLRGWVKDFVGLDQTRLALFFQSFGFKNGIPSDADFVFDVRCLPNPFYDPLMRPLTGNDGPVIAFLDANPDAQKMLTDIERFIAAWVPAFARDNRRSLTIALGCTGGQHRSVYFANKLAGWFATDYQVVIRHRELAT
jgi:RNase adapter protein RapZ